MPRISKRTGPPADQVITGTSTIIQNLQISRLWDEGPLLLAFDLRIDHGATPALFFQVRFRRNGSGIGGDFNYYNGVAGQVPTYNAVFLTEQPGGQAEYSLTISSTTVGTTAAVSNNRATLTVIQFPDWTELIDQ